ncbi:MAG: TRAP transporter fused permease subunit [Alphaproteobacteria bacterium]|jgi:TRAP transporter 4TM/12TM fusion protein|nr:TRAP transporter fused permease subunit [Alphaproteobacteria bacterium]
MQPWVKATWRALAALMTFAALLWNIDLPQLLGFAPVNEQYYAFIMALALAVVFLSVRINRSEDGRAPWYDLVLAGASIIVLFYVAAHFIYLKDVHYAGSTDLAIGIGAILTVLILDGLRRSAGYVMLIVAGIFVIYAPFGHLVPGQLVGSKVELWKFFTNMAFNPNALFGIPLQVGTTIVIMFILFGQVLMKAGGGQFFTDIAMATVGRRRGGAAKISVVASGLFGTISGTAVSNVVTTGIITIPLMQKAGYRATHAGAIEAIASTGGQFMPPIMGAAAFLMAEMLEVPYSEIVIAAIVPSLLYYFAVFVQVDLVAAKENITFVEVKMPRAMAVLRDGWHFILPFGVLIYTLFELNLPPEKAAIYSTATLVISLFKEYRGEKLRLSDLYGVFADTGRVVIELLMIVSTAGFVIGILNLTGLGFALTFSLVGLAGDSMLVLLLIAAVICIVLGMGMPTLAIYVLLGALIAPAIVEAGVEDIPAHLFILYFGMMSMITPPIALAAFAASTLTKADPMATGFAAMKFGWTAYLVPFLFVFSPTLILFGEPADIAIDVTTVVIGTYYGSIAVVGYFVRNLNFAMRTILGVAGLAAMCPHGLFDGAPMAIVAGVAVGAILLGFEFMTGRKSSKAETS